MGTTAKAFRDVGCALFFLLMLCASMRQASSGVKMPEHDELTLNWRFANDRKTSAQFLFSALMLKQVSASSAHFIES
eukprot:12557082-Alexandrium_andersonii.AAC.1